MADPNAPPDWLAQMDAQAAQPVAQGTPDWLTQMDAQTPPAPVAPPATPVGHAVSKPVGSGYGVNIPNIADAYNFLRTAATNGLSSMAGAVIGAPNPVTMALDAARGKPPADPAAVADHATNYFANKIYNAPVIGGPEYQPQTTVGQYGMAGAEFALPAALGDPEAVVPNMVRGGAAGVAAKGATDLGLPGWAGPAATALTEFLARKGGGAFSPSTVTGVDANAGRVANELPAVDPKAAPALPGLRLTVGQTQNDPQWLQLDNELGGDAAGQAESANTLNANNAVIKTTLSNVAGGNGGADAAVAQTANVRAAQKAAQASADAAWKAVPPDVSVNTAPLKTALDQHIAGVTAAGDDDLLPNAQLGRITSLPDNAPLSALQARRSRLLADASDAANAGQSNSARVIGGVAKILGDHIDNEANIVTGAPEDLVAYKAARAGTKSYYDTFGDDNQAGAQIPDLTAGKIAPEAGLARFLPPGAEGNGTQSLARLKMASGTGAGLAPARDYLVGKLKDAVEGGPAAFGKVMNDYGYAFNDNDLFTPAQQATFKDAQAAVGQTYAKAAPGTDLGSPQFAKLNGPTFAHAIYGRLLGRAMPLVAKGVGAGIGSAVTKLAGVPGAEEIAGQLFGGEAAGGAASNMMTNARTNIFKTLDAARKDPALAKQLQMRASAGNLKMAPNLRNMLGTLGISEAQALPGAPSP